MNLRAIVNSVTRAINPNQPVTVQVSTGRVTNADGSLTPEYAAPITLTGQVQELTVEDIRQLDWLNIQGAERTIYLNGTYEAIVRVSQAGGDLITLQDGSVWLTTRVLEQWPNWCRVAVTLQDGA